MGESRDSRQVLVEDNESTTFETTPGVEVLNTFDGMGLRQDLMRGIYAYGMSLLPVFAPNVCLCSQFLIPTYVFAPSFWSEIIVDFWEL